MELAKAAATELYKEAKCVAVPQIALSLAARCLCVRSCEHTAAVKPRASRQTHTAPIVTSPLLRFER